MITKLTTALLMVASSPCIALPQHEDLSTWTKSSKSPMSLNFTQYVCSGADALNDCESAKGKGCKSTTHEQGACLTSGGGKQSLSVTCKQTPLGVDVDIVVYQGVTNCTGTPNPFTEKADFCYQSGGGKSFFKYECEKKSASAGVAAGAVVATEAPMASTDFNTFAVSVLSQLGAPTTGASKHIMVGWMQQEDGKVTGGRCNPLGCTVKETGSTPFNHNNPPVQNYVHAGQGVTATVETLKNGHPHYQAMINALVAGDYQKFCKQLALSPWGTKSCAAIAQCVETKDSDGWGKKTLC